MEIVRSNNDLQKALKSIDKQASTGFIPTMGALHTGHLSLIEKADNENTYIVCSIFVNPSQFDSSEDYKKYPRDLGKDIQILKEQGICDLVFVPNSPEEVYTKEYAEIDIDFQGLDTSMEGEFRPGHFKGVVNVVNQLFSLIKPDRAYFGEKDFQQLAIVRHLVKSLDSNIDIVGCPIIREENGLAMSSRNERLTTEQRKQASVIYVALTQLRLDFIDYSLKTCRNKAIATINHTPDFKVEYLSVVDGNSLQPINEWHDSDQIVACIAVYVGKVRLIDNITILNQSKQGKI